jgi:hypothetical protein
MHQQAQTKCDMKSVRKWYGAMILTGAILWVVVGIIFSLREPGNGNGVYRKTHDLIFLLGIGITLILTSLAHLLWLQRHSSKKLAVTAVINVLGGLTFLSGGILVAINPGPFPLILFIGYPISAAGIILTGVFGRQFKLFSSGVSFTIMAMGIALLFFNDQYMPWMASVLGGAAIWLTFRFFFRTHQFRSWHTEAPKETYTMGEVTRQ